MEPICHDCAHYFRPTEADAAPEYDTCTAFYPKPIPDDIMLGEFDHHEPHPQQENKDIVFISLSPLKKPGAG